MARFRFEGAVSTVLHDLLRPCLPNSGFAAISVATSYPSALHFPYPPILIQQRSWYYRFQKRIGKGNWKHYIERYQRPPSLENKQRIVYNYRPQFLEAKAAASWRWILPKAIAKATTSEQILDCVVTYRNKRKTPRHYMEILQRLVDVGGCDPSDWRFQLIVTRVRRNVKRFIDLPQLCHYYAHLHATNELEKLVRFLLARLHLYTPKQLTLIADGFGMCHLYDSTIFKRLASQLTLQLSQMASSDMATVAKKNVHPHRCFFFGWKIVGAFAATMDFNYKFLTLLSAEIQYRVCTPPMDDFPEDALVGSSSSLLSSSTPKIDRIPTLQDLVTIAEAFATVKFQDFQYFSLCASLLQQRLFAGSNYSITPSHVAQMVEALAKAKVNDIPLLENVLAHVDAFIFDYPPTCIAMIGNCTVKQLPSHLPHIRKIHQHMLMHLWEHLPLFDASTMVKSASFLKKSHYSIQEKYFLLLQLSNYCIELENQAHQIFDVGRLMEVFISLKLDIPDVYNILCKQIHRHLELFEPVDFARVVRSL
ncbi:hypothetical protein IE077_001064, partial [Cardiosporidium cionae]